MLTHFDDHGQIKRKSVATKTRRHEDRHEADHEEEQDKAMLAA
jgi:hypothetical protein